MNKLILPFIMMLFFAFGVKAQDLAITGFSIGDTQKSPGDNFDAVTVVTNQGNVTSAPTTLIVSVFRPPLGGMYSFLAGIVEEVAVPALAPGATWGNTTAVTQVSNYYGNSNYAVAYVNYRGTASESTTSNNYKTVVYKSWFDNYTLSVTNASLSQTTNVSPSQPITATCKVTNISYATAPFTHQVKYTLTHTENTFGYPLDFKDVPYLAAQGGNTTLSKSINVIGTELYGDVPPSQFDGWFVGFQVRSGPEDYAQFSYGPSCPGCRQLLDDESLETTSIDQLSVYPNPSSGVFNLTTGSQAYNRVTVYNTLGEKVLSQSIENDLSVAEIDLSSFETGFYILKLQGDTEQETIRIIKE